jgi:hypothetical protein
MCEAAMGKVQRLVVEIVVGGMACLAAGADEPRAARELENLWGDLGTDDPVKAHRTIAALVAQPTRTVSFLKGRLQPVPAPSRCQLARLLANLDSENFAERQKATQELEQFAEAVEPALRQALQGRSSLEAGRRIQRLLEQVKTERLQPSSDRRRAVRAVEVLEQIGDPRARRVLATLAGGASAAQLTTEAKTALERLAQRPPNMP